MSRYTKIEYTKGSGNVYQDLGFVDSEERQAKAKLALFINELIENRAFTQKEAAEMLKINQPKVSALMNGRLAGFSIERLMHFLNLLDQDIEISIRPKESHHLLHGNLTVAFTLHS
jgi:predicted XRE-type DNA-binding protein